MSTQLGAFTFKESLYPSPQGVSLGALLIIGLLVLLFILKRYKRQSTQTAACQLIEKTILSNKTSLYIIQYGNQDFLIADNQQAVAIHQLPSQGAS